MFKERIRESYDDLTPSFRRIADFMLNNTLEVAFLTATDLASRVEVDTATVVRFAQELDYSGSRELMDEIKSYVHDRIAATHEEVGKATSVSAQLHALARSVLSDLEGFASTEVTDFEKPVKILSQAPHIWITGEYMTYDLAVFVQKAFQLIDLNSTAFVPDRGSTASVLSRMRTEDVLLALVSLDSGIDTGKVVRKAREKGIQTVAISGSSVSVVAREAELSVTIPIKVIDGIPRFAFLLLVIALIWETVARQRAEESGRSFFRFREELEAIL
jgi:DNA-binding MurR/RpiR family transcriptional regulator